MRNPSFGEPMWKIYLFSKGVPWANPRSGESCWCFLGQPWIPISGKIYIHQLKMSFFFFCLPWSKIHHAEDFLAGNAALGESLTFSSGQTIEKLRCLSRQYCHFADGFCLVALLACFSQEVWLILYQLLWPFVVFFLFTWLVAIVAIFYSWQLGYVSHHILS